MTNRIAPFDIGWLLFLLLALGMLAYGVAGLSTDPAHRDRQGGWHAEKLPPAARLVPAAEEPARPEWRQPIYVAAVVTRVIDGDTFVADIELPWQHTWKAREIRALGFDAPESRQRAGKLKLSPAELERGKKTTQRFKDLLATNPTGRIYLVAGSEELDAFGRLLCWTYVPTADQQIVSLAAWMKEHNLVK